MTQQNSSDLALTEIIKLIPGYDPYAQAGDCVFDEASAAYAIGFIETCIRHAKGKRAGQLFKLELWEKAIVANLFGWKRPDGTRRYREALIYIAKKNGKTAFVAALLIMMMTVECKMGAECYSAASSRDQAALLFSHAVGMVKQETELRDRLSIYGDRGGSQQRAIINPDMSASYKCLAADANTADGVAPYFVAVDELHRHDNPELAEVLQKSTAEQAEPLVIYTTTADYNRPSLCNTMVKRARQVRDNKGDPQSVGYDPAFLPVIYEASEKDDFREPATWRKANPNLDVTLSTDFLSRECKKAEEIPSELNNFLRLHLNIVTDADEVWMPSLKWDRCGGLVENETAAAWRKRMLEQLSGEPCFVGVDLSAKIDITAVVQIWRPAGDRKWIVIPHFWVPADTAIEKERTDRVPYSAWERAGFVTMTNGSEIDSQAIRSFINSIDRIHPVCEIGYDDWNATELSRQLREEDGFDDRMVIVRQGSRSLSDPMKEIEAMVAGNRIEHGANPVMNWMIGNLAAHRDDNGNIQPSKKKSTNKIDGPVALITGMARALLASDDQPELTVI